MSRRNIITFGLFLFVITVIVLWVACQKIGTGNPVSSLEEWEIDTLYAYPPVFSFQGQGVIYARIVNAETGEPYTRGDMDVTFSTNHGAVSPVIAFTDADGIAQTELDLSDVTDSSETLITVSAKITRPTTKRRYLTIVVRSGSYVVPASISLRAVVDSVFAGGTDSAIVEAVLRDSLGRGIANANISFIPSGGIIIPSTPVVTNSSGQAYLYVPPTDEPATAQLIGYPSGFSPSAISDTIDLHFIERPAVNRIDIIATPQHITANGTDTSIIAVEVFAGDPPMHVPDGTWVYFTSSDGDLLPYGLLRGQNSFLKRSRAGKERFYVKGVSGVSRKAGVASITPQDNITVPTTNGMAYVKLRSSIHSGQVQLSARVESFTEYDTIYFDAGPPSIIHLSARDSSITGDGLDTTSVFAYVYDQYDNAVTSGYRITFSTDLGSVIPTTAITNDSGLAITKLRSQQTSGFATVHAEYSSSVFNDIQVFFESTVPRVISLELEPRQLTADGTSQAVVRAQALDEHYYPVTNGVPIVFDASIGALSASGRLTKKSAGNIEKLSVRSQSLRTQSTFIGHTSGGWAEVVLTSGTVADTCVLTAYFLLDSTEITAADTEYVPFLPGNPNSITITFSRDTILASGEDTCTVSAALYDLYGNSVLSGESVDFTPSSGTVYPPSAYTNDYGIATTQLTSSVSTGIFTVSATSGSAFGMGQIYFIATLPTEITLSTSSFTLPADGMRIDTLTAYIYDSDSRPISDGVRVTFESDMGEFTTLSLAREVPAPASAAATITLTSTYYAYTSGGQAIAYLMSPTDIGRATVTATVASSDSTNIADTVFIDYVPGSVHRIEVWAVPETVFADGSSTADVYARLYDSFDNPLGADIYVAFSTTLGSIIETGVTDSTGTAHTTLTSATTSGTAQIEASVGSIRNLTNVYFVGASVAEVILTGTVSTITVGTGVDTLRALVLDSTSTPVSDGIPVSFSATLGEIIPPTASTHAGVAETYLYARDSVGTDTVVALVDGVADTLIIRITAGAPSAMELSAEPDSIYGDGISTSLVSALVKDASGNPVGAGYYVDFSTDIGSIVATGMTDSTGTATAVFTSATVTGITTVQATCGGASAITHIYLVSSPATTVILTPTTHELSLGDTDTLNVLVLDSLGYPVADGARVEFSSVLGEIIPPAVSTISGAASSYLYTRGTTGTDTIIARVGTIADTEYVEIVAGVPATMVLSAEPDTIYANGVAQSVITAQVLDDMDNPVGDGFVVSFSTDAGTISPTGVTDTAGIATATLKSGTAPTTATVQASISGISAYIGVEFIGSDAAVVQLLPSSGRISMDEVDTLNIVVYDSAMEPISDGTRVFVTSELGLVMPPVVQTTGGNAVTYLYPSGAAGTDTVVATVGMVSDTAFITIEAGAPATIVLDATPDTIYANGLSTSLISAQVLDGDDHPVGAGVVVSFSADMGSITGSAVTDTAGMAYATFSAGTEVGTAIVQASVDAVVSTVPVVLLGSDVANLVIIPYRSEVGLDDVDTLQIFAYDSSGMYVSDGTRIFLRASLSQVVPMVVQTSGGSAIALLDPQTTVGTDTVIATAGLVEDTVAIGILSGNPNQIIITASPDTIYANGLSTSRITALVQDRYGNPVNYGTTVNFSTDLGSITSIGLTDSSGYAYADLTSSTTVGAAMVTVSSGDASNIIPVVMIGSAAARVVLVPSATLISTSDTDSLTVMVYDSSDVEISDGTRVFFSSKKGEVMPRVSTTLSGVAHSFFYPSRSVGVDTVIATVGMVSDTAVIMIEAGAPATITMWAVPDTIYANGSATSTIFAEVWDDGGNAVGDGVAVTFSTSLGSVTSMAVTDTSGIAQAILHSGTETGTAEVQGSAGGVNGIVPVEFIGSPAARIDLYASSVSVELGVTDTLRAMVYDSSDVEISDGTRVFFSNIFGEIMPRVATTASGSATSIYRSTGTIGTDTVIATVGMVSDTIAISVTPGAPAIITVAASPDTIYANGIATSVITASVFDSHGNPVGMGVEVDFSSTLGSIDGIGYTDSLGVATATLQAGMVIGTAHIQGAVGEVVGVAQVAIVGSNAARVILRAVEHSIQLGQTDSLIASVFDSTDTPISDGTRVFFNSVLASMTPPVAVTSDGDAVSILTPLETVGYDTIIASVGLVADTQVVQIEPGPPVRIVLTTTPDTIPADGFSISTIDAYVYDDYDNPVGAGVEVDFSTTLGSIAPTVTYTDSSGYCQVQLTAASDRGTAIVQAATPEGAHGQTQVWFISTAAAQIILSVEKNVMTVDETSNSLTAMVLDSTGRSITDGTLVSFSSTLGDIIPPTGSTSGGVVTSNLTPGTTAGLDTVIAYSSIVADTQFVLIQAGRCQHIVVSANPDSIAADGRSQSQIIAACSDFYGNTLPVGRSVAFTTTLGSIYSPTVTDSLGVARTYLTSSLDLGTATIQASCEDGIGVVNVDFIPSPVAFISIQASPRQVVADGTSSSTVTARLLDANGIPVPDGTLVIFHSVDTTTGLPLGDIDTLATTTGGVATVNLVSETQLGVAAVTASRYGIVDMVFVEFIPGPPAEIVLTATPDSIPADGMSISLIDGIVYDEFSNRVARGEVVDFATTLGDIDPNQDITDDSGKVQIELTSVRVEGRANVTATSGDATGFVRVQFTPLVAANIVLSSDSISMIANGYSSTQLTVVAYDSVGFPVPDGTPIILSTTAGLLLPPLIHTTDGVATATLTAGTTVDTAYVVADAGGGVVDSITIVFIPGEASHIMISVSPNSIPADGESTATVTAIVEDTNGNIVAGGTQVMFTSTLGSIDSLGFTDSTGTATTTFHAGIVPGVAQIYATSGSGLAMTTVTLTNTSVATIYVTIDPNRLVAEGTNTATISGRAMNSSGLPVSDGTPITLSVDSSLLGSVIPVTALTDSGNFSGTFTVGRITGTAKIYADGGGGVIDSTDIELTPGPPDSIALSADSASLKADSLSTSYVYAQLYDRYGNAVGSGVDVNFTASLGEVEGTGTTNSSGQTQVLLRSGRLPGLCRVNAVSGDARQELDIPFNATSAFLVVVDVDDVELVADGLSSTIVHATVTDTSGTPISDGAPISFIVLPDTSAGDTLGLMMPNIAYTSSGVATTSFRVKYKTGLATIRALADASHFGDAFVDVIPGPPDSIGLYPVDTVLQADGASNTDIVAILYDRYGNSLRTGTNVSFSTTLGTIAPASIVTNSAGQVITTLTAGNSPGIARVTAMSGDAYNTVDIRLQEVLPAYLSLLANPRKITADGVSTSSITARVLNTLGTPVADGTIVYFHSVDTTTGLDFGTIDTLSVTSGGSAVVTLTSETRTGTAIVSARCNTLYDTTSVDFIPGPVAIIRVSSYPETLYADGRSTSRISVVMQDAYGNRVAPGTVVSVSTDLGSIFPTTTFSDTLDTVYALYTAANELGRATITVTSGTVTGMAMVELVAPVAASLDLFIDSLSLTADGNATTSIRATVFDSLGLGVADGTPVFFSTTAGMIFPGVVYTTDGQAFTTLRSGIALDTAIVVAYAGSTAVDSGSVVFRAGPPYTIAMTPDSATMSANGAMSTQIRCDVSDQYGHPVADGYILNFSTTLGSVDTFAITSTVAGTSGVAYTTLRSGTTPGTALVTGTVGDALGYCQVDFYDSDIDEIVLSVDPFEVVADGRSTGSLTGFARNSAGNPVSDGTPIAFSVIPDSMGNISPSTAYSDSGAFSATFTAGMHKGRADLVATIGTVAETTWVDLIPGAPDSIALTASALSIPADSATLDTIYGTVYDRYGNTVGSGVTVTLSTTMGDVLPTSTETDNAGQFIAYIRSSYQIGVARITAIAGDARGELSITFAPTTAINVSLTANPRILTADGFSESQLTATVLDTFGHPVSDGTPVVFNMMPDTLGDLIPTIVFTESGTAPATFRAGDARGVVYISATVGTVADTIFLTLDPGAVSNIVLTADDSTLSANNRDHTNVYAALYDAFGNLVLAGQNVTFNTTLGGVVPTSTITNGNGIAFTQLTAGTTPGDARVSAQSGTVFEVIDITLASSHINSIVLNANPNQLTADGASNSVITASVYDQDGSPVTDGTVVSFSVSSGDIVSPKLTLGGSVTTTYTAPTLVGNGLAWIYATVIDTTVAPADTVTDSIWVKLIPGVVTSIYVWTDSTRAVPDTIPADGTTDIWVYATLRDEFGNPLLGGNAVTFETDHGTITTSAITDTSGSARTLLISSFDPSIATITARSGSAIGFGQVIFDTTQVGAVLLSADNTTLTADGTSNTNLTAEVYTPDGHPVSNNTRVDFTVQGGYATPLPATAYTDSGIAIIQLRADTVAVSNFTVWAVAGTDSGTVTMHLIPGEPARIVMMPTVTDSVHIPADGVTATAVACTVFDAFSNPVAPGTGVTFQTTLGSISSGAFTDMDGYALGQFTAGTEIGVALISAQSGSAMGFTQIILDSLSARTLVLMISPSTIPADGSSPANITALVYDSTGMPVSDGTQVTFSMDTSGTYVQGVITPRVGYTASGEVDATLTPIGTKGSCRVIASVGATVADSFTVTFTPGDPAIIIFDTVTCSDSLPADGASYPVRVYVYDANWNGVALGTSVNFATTLGSIVTPALVDDADSGTATTYISSLEIGSAIVTATSGAAMAAIRRIDFYPIVGSFVNLVVNPVRLTADGVSSAAVTATVLDTSGGVLEPVSDGTPVFFSTTAGNMSPITAYTTDGIATTTLGAGIIAVDSVRVVARVNASLADTVYLDFIAGNPSIIEFNPPSDLYADGYSSETLWVSITDDFGNPVSNGLPVSFSSTMGSVTPSTVTNDTGYAYSILTAGTTHGPVTVSATASGITGYANLNFLPVTPDSLHLVVIPITLIANGSSTANLTAAVFDSTGTPVSDGNIVMFSTSNGLVSPIIATTASGIATATLTAGTSPDDSVWITASAGATTLDSVLISFTAGPPSMVVVEATDSLLTANATDRCTLLVSVYDEYGNSVESGIEVDFTSTLGVITPSSYTDANGVATAELVTERVSGWCQVQATAEGVVGAILIQFAPTSVGAVDVVVTPTEIVADGVSTAAVRVTVLDSLGFPVSDGTPVQFTDISKGIVEPIYSTTTSGVVTATLTSLTMTGSDSLRAMAGDSSDTAHITFIAGAPDRIVISPQNNTILANGTDTTTVRGIVYDQYSHPVRGGYVVNFAASPSELGTVSPVNTTTDTAGSVSVVFTAGVLPGVVNIQATSGAASGMTQIELTPMIVGRVVLTLDSRTLPADGTTSTQAHALVLDSLDSPITDGTLVHFGFDTSTTAILYPGLESTASGYATVTLTASTAVETVGVFAYVNVGAGTVSSDTLDIVFTPGEPATITFDSSGTIRLTANGADIYYDSVTVYDIFGNRVPTAIVNYSLTKGYISPSSDITSDAGRAGFQVTAPMSVGYTVLQATSGTAIGYKSIQFQSTGVDSIRVTIVPSGLPADGTSTAQVRATVLDATGSPASDSLVINFSAKLGVINPSAYTSGGSAITSIIAADVYGVDTVWAFYQAESSYATVTYEAGPPYDITIDIEPTIDTVGSSSMDTVTVRVRDERGNPVAPGTIVNLSINDLNYGTLSDYVIGTDDTGYVQVLFTPGSKAGICWIGASSGTVSDSAYIVMYAGAPHTLEFSVSADAIYVGGAGEIDQSVITASVYDLFGNPVRDSTQVVFTITSYPGGALGEWPFLEPNTGGNMLISPTIYTLNGNALVTLRAGTASGVAKVQADVESGTVISEAPRITISSGLPASVSLSQSNCNVRGWDIDGVPDSITAIVSDSMGNPVAPGTAVYFFCDEGTITGADVTDSSGFAHAIWYSSDPRVDGIIEVYARTRGVGGSYVADTVYFFSSGPPDTISSMFSSPSIILADGSSTSDIWMGFQDVNRNPVADSIFSVSFTTDFGAVTTPQTIGYACGDAEGWAVATYTSAVTSSDENIASGIPGEAKTVSVGVNYGFLSSSVNVQLNHDVSSASDCSIIVPAELPSGVDVPVGVVVVDSYGNPIGGESVTFLASDGAWTAPTTVTTDAVGSASALYTTPAVGANTTVIISVTLNTTGGLIQQSITVTP